MNFMIRKLFAAAAVAWLAVGAAPTANADPMADLMGMLPGGYDEGACFPAPPPVPPAALASVDCNANSIPGGPTHARYLLYPNNDTLMHDFEFMVNRPEFQRVPCPGMHSDKPVPVEDEATGKQVGFIACGVITDPRYDQPGHGSPAILWATLTNGSIGNAHGSDIQSMWDWMTPARALV